MERAPVSAKDLLPKTFGGESDEEDNSSMEYEENGNTEDIVDDLEYDVYNLLACNYHAIRVPEKEDKEEVFNAHFQRAAQLLMKK